MPLYIYICNNCNNLTEIEHGIEDKTDQQCQYCLSSELKKVPSIVSFKHKKELKENLGHQPGEIVKQSIDEIKNDVKAEKESLSKRIWTDPNK